MAMTGVQDLLKFKDLVRRLKITSPHALGILETIWLYCHQHAMEKRGILFSVSDLEALAEWEGEDGLLVRGMTDSGWLDMVGETVHPHDYWDHAPDFAKKRISRSVYRKSEEKEPKQEKPRSLTGENAKTPVSDRPTKPSITKPSITVPNLTEPYREQSAAEILKTMGINPPPPLIDELMVLTGDKPIMRPWWQVVIDRHANGHYSDLLDDLSKIRDCQNAETRQAKDYGGEFTDPGKWLYVQCKNRLSSLPRLPKEGK